MTDTPTMRSALTELSRGAFIYSAAGWHRPETFAYFGTQTLEALERRGLARLVHRERRKHAKAVITPRGRRALEHEGSTA